MYAYEEYYENNEKEKAKYKVINWYNTNLSHGNK